MNLKFELLLLFIGGLLRIADIGSVIWYILTQKFDSDLLYYLFLASIIAPSAALLCIYMFLAFSDLCKSQKFSFFKFLIFLLFIIGDSLGITYFIFTGILCCTNFFVGDFYIIDSMFRATCLITSLFRSIPQVIMQIYNNQKFNSWNILTIISIGASFLSFFYTILKLAYSIDKVQQYESVYSKSAKPTDEKHQLDTGRNVIKNHIENYDEPYDQSN